MVRFSDLRQGDYVLAEADGRMWQGEVIDLNHDEKEVGIDTGVQKFYFKSENLQPIPVDEDVLLKMKFQKRLNEDGSVKYMKGAFRIQIPVQDDFSNYEIWYRDEKRHIFDPIFLHNLQNHYEDMTKVRLTDRPI